MVGAALIGMDIRLCAPESLWPEPAIKAHCDVLAAPDGGKIVLTTDVAQAVKDCDFIYTDVWVSMGEPDSVWAERIKLLTPYRVTSAVMAATGNPHSKFMHCRPAFHNRDTEVGEATFQTHGIACMEVPMTCSSLPRPWCSIRPKTGCTPSKQCLSPRWEPDPADRSCPWRQCPAETWRADDL